MNCPKCDRETFVIDSRLLSNGSKIRRRSKCLKCEHRFTTYETEYAGQLTAAPNAILQADAMIESFIAALSAAQPCGRASRVTRSNPCNETTM